MVGDDGSQVLFSPSSAVTLALLVAPPPSLLLLVVVVAVAFLSICCISGDTRSSITPVSIASWQMAQGEQHVQNKQSVVNVPSIPCRYESRILTFQTNQTSTVIEPSDFRSNIRHSTDWDNQVGWYQNRYVVVLNEVIHQYKYTVTSYFRLKNWE